VLCAGLGGVCGVYQQACPVDGLRLAWASPLWRNAYTASLTAARHQVSVPGAGGTRRPSRPPLRLPRRAYAGREAEKPYASVAAHVFGHRLHQSVHKRRRAGRAEAAGIRPAVTVLKWTPVYIAGDGCSSSSGLTHLSPHLSNLKFNYSPDHPVYLLKHPLAYRTSLLRFRPV